MSLNSELLQAIEDAADAFARLDELVARSAPGLSTLLMLRSAQTIVAANDRPLGDPTDSATAFAALLGWWYTPAARPFIHDDSHLRGVALALQAAADAVQRGRVLTSGLLDDVMAAVEGDLPSLPDLLDATLSVAEREAWPALLLAADLSGGACGRERAVSASIARAVAPLASRKMANVYVVTGPALDTLSALHLMADEAREMRRRVDAYVEEGARLESSCRALGRGGASAAALGTLLAGRPAMTVADAAETLAMSAPTAGAAMERLMGIGALREITGRGRDRVFVYTPAVTLAF